MMMKRISACAARKIKISTDRLEATYLLRRILNGTEDKTTDEVEYIVQFLVHHTEIASETWWEVLSYSEKRQLITGIEFYKVEKDSSVELIFDPVLCREAYIILRGTGHGVAAETDKTELDIEIEEGSVLGWLIIPPILKEAKCGWKSILQQEKPRVKRLALGPHSEYLVIRTESIEQRLKTRATDMAKQRTIRALGLEMLLPFVRTVTIPPGTVIIQKGDVRDQLYIIESGECRAYIAEKDLATVLPKDIPPDRLLLSSKKRFAIASLGPQSLIGNISLLFSITEPFTVESVTSLEVHTFSLRHFSRGMRGKQVRLQGMLINAYKRLDLFVQRIFSYMDVHETPQAPLIQKYYDDLLDTLRPTIGLGQRPSISLDVIEKVSEEETERRQRDRNRKQAARRVQILSEDPQSNSPVEGFNLGRSNLFAHAMTSLHSPMKRSLSHSRLNEAKSFSLAQRGTMTLQQTSMDFFPTMTLNRRYHGSNLPNLPTCNGFESPYKSSSTALQHYVYTKKHA